MPSIGLIITLRISLRKFVWLLFKGVNRPVGTLDGEAKYLSQDLGLEADLFVDYKATSTLA